MIDFLSLLFTDYTVRTVALGAMVLGITSGALGTFAMLRRQSLLGDAMSHAALPGVVLAFMVTRSKAPIVLILGAAAAGILGTLFFIYITRATRIKEDSALGIILSVFFGLGLMLLTLLQRNPDARQAGLNSFLFGQAATLLIADVITMAILAGLVLALTFLFWKEFKLLSFDREFGASLGLPMQFLDILLTTLLVIAIVIGLQAVGVVLMSAMVVAPAAAARQWTDRLGLMLLLSSAFGALAGVGGTLVSSLGRGLSTGPVIVLAISIIVLISLTLAPNRGLLWNAIRRYRNRRELMLETVLKNLYDMGQRQHGDPQYPHGTAVLQALSFGRGGVSRSLKALADYGWVRHVGDDRWALTPEGVAETERYIQPEKMDP